MRTVLGVALAMLLTLSAAAAWAGEIEGTIQKLDPAERTFVLDNGTQLWLAEGLSMENLKEGATVKASYEERDGKNVVTTLDVR